MGNVYFVWVQIGSRINAQKWYGKPVTGTGSNLLEPLVTVELSEGERDWPLDALKMKYPYVGPKEKPDA